MASVVLHDVRGQAQHGGDVGIVRAPRAAHGVIDPETRVIEPFEVGGHEAIVCRSRGAPTRRNEPAGSARLDLRDVLDRG